MGNSVRFYLSFIVSGENSVTVVFKVGELVLTILVPLTCGYLL